MAASGPRDTLVERLRSVGTVLGFAIALLVVAWALLIALGAGVGKLVQLGETQRNARSPQEQAEEAVRTAAWRHAKAFVKERLTLPSSADFGDRWYGNTQTPQVRVLSKDGSGTRFKCKGWVESKNAFGATVRSDFECIVRQAARKSADAEQGDDQEWTLESLEVHPR